MKAFDTDILTEILAGNPTFADRVAKLSLDEQYVPIVAIEEILRASRIGDRGHVSSKVRSGSR